MTVTSVARTSKTTSSRTSRLALAEAPADRQARVIDRLRKFLQDEAVAARKTAKEFEEFETKLHQRFLEAQREIVAEVMSASDIDADAIMIEGRVHRRVLKSKQTYMTAVGEVAVERWLYKDRTDPTAHALAAMDLRLGIIEGFWTTRAAKQAAWWSPR